MIRRVSVAMAVMILIIIPTAWRPMLVYAQSETAVSREAVGVLFSGPEGLAGRAFDLRVGAAPADFPADLLPEGARVRVSADLGRLAAVVAVVTRFSADERLAFEERLEGAGWVNPLRPAGFVAREMGPNLSLCRGERFATLSFLSRSEGGMYVRASVATEPGRACSTQVSSPAVDVQLPSMPVPAGARSGRVSMGGTPEAMYSSIRLGTSDSAGTIGAYYAGQLTASGWVIDGPSADGQAMSVTRLRSGDGSRAPVTALLVVTAVAGSDEVDVLLRLVQPQGATGIRDER